MDIIKGYEQDKLQSHMTDEEKQIISFINQYDSKETQDARKLVGLGIINKFLPTFGVKNTDRTDQSQITETTRDQSKGDNESTGMA